jgi:hypothetical protein
MFASLWRGGQQNKVLAGREGELVKKGGRPTRRTAVWRSSSLVRRACSYPRASRSINASHGEIRVRPVKSHDTPMSEPHLTRQTEEAFSAQCRVTCQAPRDSDRVLLCGPRGSWCFGLAADQGSTSWGLWHEAWMCLNGLAVMSWTVSDVQKR